MTVREHVLLAPYTSLGVGGPARFFIEARSVDDVRDACIFAREHELPLLPLGGGSNILVPDAGVRAVVLRIATDTVSLERVGDRTLLVSDAGVAWDTVAATAVRHGLWGIENLAGIPGSVGGALVQNIGAYGQAVSDTVAFVEVLDVASGETVRLAPSACAFDYRDSAFKHGRSRVLLHAAFSLSSVPAPNLSYRDLAERFGTREPTLAEIRDAILDIRRAKFPDLSREGSAGSFFKNIIIPRSKAPLFQARYPDMPLFSMPETAGVKVPLAWVLDHVLHMNGFSRGPVRLFERQPLVIVTSEGAHAADVEALAREVEGRVHGALGITIEREVESFC